MLYWLTSKVVKIPKMPQQRQLALQTALVPSSFQVQHINYFDKNAIFMVMILM